MPNPRIQIVFRRRGSICSVADNGTGFTKESAKQWYNFGVSGCATKNSRFCSGDKTFMNVIGDGNITIESQDEDGDFLRFGGKYEAGKDAEIEVYDTPKHLPKGFRTIKILHVPSDKKLPEKQEFMRVLAIECIGMFRETPNLVITFNGNKIPKNALPYKDTDATYALENVKKSFEVNGVAKTMSVSLLNLINNTSYFERDGKHSDNDIFASQGIHLYQNARYIGHFSYKFFDGPSSHPATNGVMIFAFIDSEKNDPASDLPLTFDKSGLDVTQDDTIKEYKKIMRGLVGKTIRTIISSKKEYIVELMTKIVGPALEVGFDGHAAYYPQVHLSSAEDSSIPDGIMYEMDSLDDARGASLLAMDSTGTTLRNGLYEKCKAIVEVKSADKVWSKKILNQIHEYFTEFYDLAKFPPQIIVILKKEPDKEINFKGLNTFGYMLKDYVTVLDFEKDIVKKYYTFNDFNDVTEKYAASNIENSEDAKAFFESYLKK